MNDETENARRATRTRSNTLATSASCSAPNSLSWRIRKRIRKSIRIRRQKRGETAFVLLECGQESAGAARPDRARALFAGTRLLVPRQSFTGG
eukprot:742496-Prymnesium_polylepis.1